MPPSERPISRVVEEPRLPREAMLFFVCAPPVLAMLFDPHCLNTLDNILRAWLAITLYSCVTGVLVHHAFEWVERRLSRSPIALRLLAHLLTTAVVVTLATFAQHGYVHFIYPEIGDDIAGVVWRALLVGIVYLWVASFVGHLQRRAVEERMKAHHARTAALEARLHMLQSQLQPHFLFNSLNVCAGLVHSAPDVAEATIDKLSAFLRYTLEASKEPRVPLARELDAVSAYLDIQRERFGDRLQHEITVEGVLDDAPSVPPMLLQPLVENALVHGVSSAKGGSVRIHCRRTQGAYTISIEDSGGGSSAPGTGTGQENVRERLHLLYGANGHLDCHSTSSGGYVATVSLPLPATPHHPLQATVSPA